MPAYSSGLKITVRTVRNQCFVFVHSSGSRFQLHCYKSMLWSPFMPTYSSASSLQSALLQIHSLIPVYVHIFFRPQDYSPPCFKSIPQAWDYSLHCYKSMIWSSFMPTYSSGLKITVRTVTNPCFDPRLCWHCIRAMFKLTYCSIPQSQDITVRTVVNTQSPQVTISTV